MKTQNIKSETTETLKGKIIGISNEEAVTTNAKNVVVFGSAGTGKTQKYACPNVLNSILNEESIVVTDPGRTIYEQTVHAARENGYKVYVLNFQDPEGNNQWNPLEILQKEKDEVKVQKMAQTIIQNASLGNKPDLFFDQSEENLLAALICYVAMSEHYTGEKRDFAAVYDLLQDIIIHEGKCEALDKLSKEHPDDPAVIRWRIFSGVGRLRMNFATGMALKLKALQIQSIRNMLSSGENSIDITNTGEKKIIFLTFPVCTNYAKPFISLFISQILKAYHGSGNKLHLILDEAPGIGKIYDIYDYLAGDRNISISLIVMDIDQLKSRYHHEIKPILYASTLVTMGTVDTETASLFDSKDPERIFLSAFSKKKNVLFKETGQLKECEPYDYHNHPLYKK